jgi:uncharacterized SAM-binding protein YcdF (DUF218 family)
LIDTVWIKAVLKALFLPPGGLLLLALAGLALRRRLPRTGIALAWASVLALLALSLPVVAYALQHSLATARPVDAARLKTAQAIVILGGGSRKHAPEYGGASVSDMTLERARYGARLARSTRLPVLVAGGSLWGGPTEGTLMRDLMEQEFGVSVRWVEERSHNTHENAMFSAEMLRDAGVHRVALVTHSFDMPRAIGEFQAAGLEVIPAPMGIPTEDSDTVLDYLPSSSALRGSYFALHEMLGEVVRQRF